MGRSTSSEPLVVSAHDGAVILTGFGQHMLLTPQAAERLASKLSGAAFAASCAQDRPAEKLEAAGWTSAPAPSKPRRDLDERPPEPSSFTQP